MSKIERYTGNLQAFGSAAQGVERTLFGETSQANDLTSQITSAFLRGWGIVGPSENPSMEDFNAAMYTMSQFIAYQHQMGIPEWDALQEYYSGSICVRNGEAYLSLVDSNIGSAPPSAKWTSVLTAKNALANISGFLKISNNLSEILAAGPAAVAAALKNLTLTDMGIGLTTQTAIANFDFQNFVFTSGANYLANSTTWLNVPAGISYPTALPISITVDYITSSGSNVGLTLIPNTATNASFIVYKVLVSGAVGSRTFSVRTEWNSANLNFGTTAGTMAVGNDARFNETTIIYPDGSGSLPYNYPANTRKEYSNPFPGKNIIVVAEVYYNGVWGRTGWFSNSTVTNAVGILATQNIATDVIVVQSGSFGVLAAATLCGSLHAATATQSTLPFRLKVYKEA
ncbi:TPA: hypothetical protein ACTR19_001274 [Yersinia enterocolitica]|uniref:hypothetical protein n=1 Tax=Yersinia enterocolitica TaxID=630 RepID=UPI00376B6123